MEMIWIGVSVTILIKPVRICSWCRQPGFRQGVTFICENPECKQCGEKMHADYNAARNIANSKDIIKEKNE